MSGSGLGTGGADEGAEDAGGDADEGRGEAVGVESCEVGAVELACEEADEGCCCRAWEVAESEL